MNHLTFDTIQKFKEEYLAHPTVQFTENAIKNTPLVDVALNHKVVGQLDHIMSHRLDTWKVTNQKSSGRCWIFAALNMLRIPVMKQLNVSNFEFSANYLLFWDKLEKANFFLDAVIETQHLDSDDRVVAWLLDNLVQDGGQWGMFVNLVNKYGLVPKSVMEETESSSSTARMNTSLKRELRIAAKEIRNIFIYNCPHNNEEHQNNIQLMLQQKEKTLSNIFRILCIHLGVPPTDFSWRYTDKDKKIVSEENLTPQQFAKKYTSDVNNYVCIVNDPRNPYNKLYTVKYLGYLDNENNPIKYLNVDINTMKKLTKESILNSDAVWMGCDVRQMFNNELGVWDDNLYLFDKFYDIHSKINKKDRLLYHQSSMTHAMLFVGLDLQNADCQDCRDNQDNQSVVKSWRVENSWGEGTSTRKNGINGFYTMNDNWFDEFVFCVAIKKNKLSDDLINIVDNTDNEDIVVLPPWDPMGTLAQL